MQAQAWICPKCHDDHSQASECKPTGVPMFEVPQDISDNDFNYIVWKLDPGWKPGEPYWYRVEIVVKELDDAVRFALPLGTRGVITKRVRLNLSATEQT